MGKIAPEAGEIGFDLEKLALDRSVWAHNLIPGRKSISRAFAAQRRKWPASYAGQCEQNFRAA